jgi:Protein of unknown function (DUF3078)
MNIKRFLIAFFTICFVSGAFAQADKKDSVKKDTVKKDTAWHIGGIINIAFSQMSFTNWAAGGQNSIGLVSLAAVYANYKKDKISWLNSLDLEYGFQKVDNSPFQKTTDKIEATSNLGYTIFKNTIAGFLVNFKSQFAPGYQFPNDSSLLSDFMAPGYLTIAAGLTYTPNKNLSVFISPATLRYTFVENQILSDEGAYGVTPGQKYLVQAGAYFKGNYSATVCKGVTVCTNLELFSNYLNEPEDIVVDWTNFIQLKVNKFLSVTINTELIYDNNTLIPIYAKENNVEVLVGKGPRTQFKELSGLGLAYNF